MKIKTTTKVIFELSDEDVREIVVDYLLKTKGFIVKDYEEVTSFTYNDYGDKDGSSFDGLRITANTRTEEV